MAETRRPWVVLDSTVFNKNDWYLERLPARLLLRECRAGRLKVAVPEVVVVECTASYEREAGEAFRKAESAQRRLSDLRVNPADIASPAVRSRLAESGPRPVRYREDLEGILTDAGATIAPIPKVSHGDLVERAARRGRPFDDKGGGYRDALVWFTVLELAEIERGPGVLISNDQAAFSESKEDATLAAYLTRELDDMGLAEGVELFFKVTDYVEKRIPKATNVIAEWGRQLKEDSAFRKSVFDALVEVAERELPDLMGLTEAPRLRSLHLVSLSNPRKPTVEEVLIEDQTTMVQVSIVADYLLEGEEQTSSPLPEGSSLVGGDVVLGKVLPDGWQIMQIRGTSKLTFEIYQHAQGEMKIEPRLVGEKGLY